MSSWNAIKIICSPFTVKLQSSTVHIEPKWERSVTGKIQSGLWLDNTCSGSCVDWNAIVTSTPFSPSALPPLMIYFLKKYLLCPAAQWSCVGLGFLPFFPLEWTWGKEGWHLITHATQQSFPRICYKTRDCMTCSRLQNDSIAHSELKTGILLTPPVFSLIK